MFIYRFPCGPLETNAYLIGSNDSHLAAVIDPAPGSADPILAKAKEKHLRIEKVLLTHSHWDHFADAHTLIEETRAPLYVHFLDAKNIEEPGADGIPLFFPIPKVTPDHYLKEGEEVEIGSLRIQVIHTPGHSPGCVCFYIEKEKILFSGDTLFQGSIGNLSLPTAKPKLMWESLEKLAKLPLCTKVYPGHGSETTIGKESWLERAKEIFSE